MTEEAIIKLCIKKDRVAQRMLYQKFISSMGRLCLRYLKQEDLAKDILTEGFLKVFNKIDKLEYRGTGSLEAWIKSIMVNECLMHLRRRELFFVEINDQYPIASEITESQVSAEEIFKIITTLPDGYRTVFNLYVIEGYSHAEISQMLGFSESASRSQLSHARKKLQEMLKVKGWN